MNIPEFLARFRNVRQTGQGEWMASCPAHQDSNASLHFTDKGDALLMHCFAGCRDTDILNALGLTWRDYPYHRECGHFGAAPKYGLTLERYAAAKRFPVNFLKSCFLADGQRLSKNGKSNPGVMMPYLNPDGSLAKMRWRMRMEKEQGTEPCRFVWEKEGEVCLYGLWRQPPDRGSVIIVEGESDSQALWLNGYGALGLPGASNYKPRRDDPILEGYRTVFVHLEKDMGGLAVFQRFAGDPAHGKPPSRILDKCRFFCLPGYKDPSDAWQKLADRPEEFRALFSNALANAKPVGQFRPPEAWNLPETPPEQPQLPMGDEKTEKRDRRAETSPINGVKGGRPQADYAGLADAFFKACAQDTESGLPLLRRWRGAWYRYGGRCWRPCIDSDIEGMAMAYIQRPRVAEEYHLQVSRNSLSNLLANLASTNYCGIPAETPAPSWLSTGEPARGWIAMGNLLVNLEDACNAWAKAVEEGKAGAADDPDADGREPSPELVERHAQERYRAAMEDFTRQPTPDLLSTYALEYDFDPDARCPKFLQWLESTLPDPELQNAIRMMMGLALVPDTTYNVCFFLSGEGGTGKSTFLEILRSLVGRANVCHVPLLKMDDKFATWPLAENLLNIVGEMPSGDPQGRLRYIEGDFKDSISGGEIHVERKGKDALSAPCIARHVFATNALPVFFDKSEGIWDRLVIIPFTRRFRGTAEERRDFAGEICAEELPGILNFAIRGLADLRKTTRFPEAAACSEAKQAHRMHCDPPKRYLAERYAWTGDGTGLETPESKKIAVEDAYKDYKQWLLDKGLAMRSEPTFIDDVRRICGIRPTRTLPHEFVGLRPRFNIVKSF